MKLKISREKDCVIQPPTDVVVFRFCTTDYHTEAIIRVYTIHGPNRFGGRIFYWRVEYDSPSRGISITQRSGDRKLAIQATRARIMKILNPQIGMVMERFNNED